MTFNWTNLFSDAENLSESGSCAKTYAAPTLSAVWIARSYGNNDEKWPHNTSKTHHCAWDRNRAFWATGMSRLTTAYNTPFSSGFGNLTVGNSGSGTCCSLTGMKEGSPKISKALATNGWLTPCIEVLTNLTLVRELRGLWLFNIETYRHDLYPLTQKHTVCLC